MRTSAFLVVIGSVISTASIAQASQEFLFTTAHGATFSRVLSADWSPKNSGLYLQITERDRVLAMDVILIRPIVPENITGLHQVRIAWMEGRIRSRSTLDVWLPDAIVEMIDAKSSGDLIPAGPQTWIRPGSFKVVAE